MRLVSTPQHTGYLSYKFDTLDAMLRAQVRIARLDIASECYGFDPAGAPLISVVFNEPRMFGAQARIRFRR